MRRKQTSAGRERLAKLATFLYRVPSDNFDMRRWKQSDRGTLSLDKNQCNTRGCAIGWATVLFAEDGFRLVPDATYGSIPMPEWGKLDGWTAIKKFLDLPANVAVALFSNTTTTANMGPRQVAVRIRKFLKTGTL